MADLQQAQPARISFVTGAAQGLGAAIAKALYSAGHSVVLGDIDKAKAAMVASEMDPARAMPVHVDVRDSRSVAAAVEACEARFGPVEILVNNAALTRARDFFDMTLDEWDEVLAVNLRSIVLTTQLTARGMMERGWGRIINLTSLSGQRGGPQVQGAHYASSKAGIVGLTRYLAHLFAEGGVTVNAIAPGPIQTEQTALAPKEKLALVASQIPLKRLGKPEEVGALAVFLASEYAGFITGTTTDINGGLQMR